jgi:4-hydroxy-2-oxovalerate/4-hydroxy-2-oxohexanoate aldolase
LDASGITLIEVAHGLGLGASRAGKGDQAATDEAYLRAAKSAVRNARFGAFFIPGIGTADDLRLAADCGVILRAVRSRARATAAAWLLSPQGLL